MEKKKRYFTKVTITGDRSGKVFVETDETGTLITDKPITYQQLMAILHPKKKAVTEPV